MQAVKAYYDGTAFVPLIPVDVKFNQAAIVTILDGELPKSDKEVFEQFFGVLSNESIAELEADKSGMKL